MKIYRRVKVDWQHIAVGVRGSASACPIALALREKGYPEARVGGWFAFLTPKQPAIQAQKIADFVTRFDSRKLVTPITLHIWFGRIIL